MKVAETFTSIQGEGLWAGTPQYFIRCGGCNLDCSWCDTGYAREGGTEVSVDKLVDDARSSRLKWSCITGGEPLLQAVEVLELTLGLKDSGVRVLLETNGTLYDRKIFNEADCVSMDVKTPSSKMKSDLEILDMLEGKDQAKAVIADEADYYYVKKLVEAGHPFTWILQPEGGGGFRWIAEKAIEDALPVRVMPQLHKLEGLR